MNNILIPTFKQDHESLFADLGMGIRESELAYQKVLRGCNLSNATSLGKLDKLLTGRTQQLAIIHKSYSVLGI